MTVRQFISRNLVALIMVPMLVGAHYGWYKLQNVESLVTAEERNNLPITKLTLQLINETAVKLEEGENI